MGYHDSDANRLHQLIARHGGVAEDYEIVERVEALLLPGLGACAGRITVRNLRTGSQRSYPERLPGDWEEAFARDLDHGLI